MKPAIRKICGLSDGSPDTLSASAVMHMDKHVHFVESTVYYYQTHACKMRKRAGDTVTMQKLVADLYLKVLSDERLAIFFKGKNMARLYEHQTRLMSMVFGDEDILMHRIQGMDLRKAHLPMILGMGLTIEHWHMFIGHFNRTLDETPELPLESKERAQSLMEMTERIFRPVEPGELDKYRLGKDGRPSWMQEDEDGGFCM